MLHYIIRSMGLRCLPMSISSVLIGLACANYQGYFDELKAFSCLLFAICAQVTVNLINCYYNIRHKCSDVDFYCKGSNIYNLGFSPETVMREVMIGSLILCAMVGASIVAYSGIWALYVGVGIVAYIYFSYGPWPLFRRGFSEITALIFYGPIGVLMPCYLLTGICTWSSLAVPFGISIGVGMIAVCVLLPFYCTLGHQSIKRTLIVRYGVLPAKIVFLIIGIAAGALILIMTGHLPEWMIIPSVVYIIGHFACSIAMFRKNVPFLKVMYVEMILLLFIALFFFISCFFIGASDQSHTMYLPR